MSWELFDIEDFQSMRVEDLLHRQEGKIREMLMVDGVELLLFHQSLEVWKLHRDDTVEV